MWWVTLLLALLEWLFKWLVKNKIDPETTTLAEAKRMMRSKNFRDWAAKQKVPLKVTVADE